MVIDSIANLINGIYNAQLRGHKTLRAPYTKLTFSIAEALKREGYVADVAKDGKDVKKHIDIVLKYDGNGTPSVSGVKRVSRQSKRIYKGVDEIKSVKNGYGTLILSTPKGIVSDKQARKEKVGGEALFEIW
jgi:small subunit ribosomal protein S8